MESKGPDATFVHAQDDQKLRIVLKIEGICSPDTAQILQAKARSFIPNNLENQFSANCL